MPACIRALNACAEKLEMDKVIGDIDIDDRTIDALAEIHMQLDKDRRAAVWAQHGEFPKALEIYMSEEKSGIDNTWVRDCLGTLYWDSLKSAQKEPNMAEVKAYLNLLDDPRNKFPDSRKASIEEAQKGLKEKLQQLEDKIKPEEKKLTTAGIAQSMNFVPGPAVDLQIPAPAPTKPEQTPTPPEVKQNIEVAAVSPKSNHSDSSPAPSKPSIITNPSPDGVKPKIRTQR